MPVDQPQRLTAPERRLATLLFADLSGYTALTSQLDPEAVHALVQPLMVSLSEIVASFGGTVPHLMGDGFLAVFGVPVAHDDDAERALRAALALLQHTDMVRSDGGPVPLPGLHVGVNTGEILVAPSSDSVGFSLTGEAINLASRLCSMASAGRILVGPRTYELCAAIGKWSTPRRRRVRGLAELVAVAELRGLAAEPSASHPLAPFVGREAELRLLAAVQAQSTSTSTSEVLLLTGEAGQGKSRLVAEFARRQRGTVVLTGRCPAYGETLPLSALVDPLARRAGVRGSPPPDVLDRQFRRLEVEADVPPGTRHALVSLLSGSSPGAGIDAVRAAQAAVQSILQGLSRQHPVLVVVDDAHAADQALRGFLTEVAQRPWSCAITFLVLARDEQGFEALRLSRLPALPDRDMRSLLDNVAISDFSGDLAAALVARAGGNPLFLEACARTMADGRGSAVPEMMPATVRMSIAARLDGLPADERRALQAASVAGDAVWDGLLAELLEDGAAPKLLAGLAARGLLEQRQDSAVPGFREFGFRHALIRDVAYEALPRSTRAQWHEQSARWLRDVEASTPAYVVPLSILAHHYEQACRHALTVSSEPSGETTRLAVAYLLRWGRHLAGLEAPAASRVFERAVALVDADSGKVGAALAAGLCSAWAATLTQMMDCGRALEIAARAVDAARRAGQESLLAEALRVQGVALSYWGDVEAARPVLADAHGVFRALGDVVGQARTMADAADTWRFAGPSRVIELKESVHDLYVDAGDLDGRLETALYLAYMLTLRGGREFDRWLEVAQRLVDDAPAPARRGELLRSRAFFAMYRGEFDEAVQLAGEAREAALLAGHLRVEGDTYLVEAVAHAALGRLDAADAACDRALLVAETLGWRRLRAMAQIARVRTAARRGEPARARALLAEARDLLSALGATHDLLDADIAEAQLDLDCGAFSVAADCATSVLDVQAQDDWHLYAVPVQVLRARASLVEAPAEARRYAEEARGSADQLGAVAWAGLADAVADQAALVLGEPVGPSEVVGSAIEERAMRFENDGLVASRTGDKVAAMGAFGRAVECWRSLGISIWLARALTWHAAAADGAKNARVAAAARREAAAVLRALGAEHADFGRTSPGL